MATEEKDTDNICVSDIQDCQCPDYAIVFECIAIDGKISCDESLKSFDVCEVYYDENGIEHLFTPFGPSPGLDYHIYNGRIYKNSESKTADRDFAALTDTDKIQAIETQCSCSCTEFQCAMVWTATWNDTTKEWTMGGPVIQCSAFSRETGMFTGGPAPNLPLNKWLTNCCSEAKNGIPAHTAIYIFAAGECDDPLDTSCAEPYYPAAPPGCSECHEYTLASKKLTPEDPTWDLTQWQGPWQAIPNAKWRLVETTHNTPYPYPPNTIDCNGTLLGLPASFTSTYSYEGLMELQIYCPPET